MVNPGSGGGAPPAAHRGGPAGADQRVHHLLRLLTSLVQAARPAELGPAALGAAWREVLGDWPGTPLLFELARAEYWPLVEALPVECARCVACGATASPMTCSGCMRLFVCDEACHRVAWRRGGHRAECSPEKRMAAGVA